MKKIVIICGPTASGKSKFALNVAQSDDSVIINADSQQVYKEIPIITAQPTEEEKGTIPHKLYGFLSVNDPCSAGIWLENAKKEINKAFEDNFIPILVGGTGLYIKSLMEGISQLPDIEQEIRDEARNSLEKLGNEEFHRILSEKDPVMGKNLHPNDSQRIMRAWEVLEQTGSSLHEWQQKPLEKPFPDCEFDVYFINPNRENLYKKCEDRFDWMIENGAIEEVEEMAKICTDLSLPAAKSLGIRQILMYTGGHMSLDKATEEAKKETRRYVKRQLTWFRNQLSDYNEINNPEEQLCKKL